MRRALLTLAVTVLLAFPLLGYDFGLILDNSTTLDYDDGDTSWSQTDRAKIWFLEDTSETWSVSAQASYVFADDRPYLFDLDELRFTANAPGILGADSLLSFAAGRYRFSEISGWVFGHTADGLTVGLNLPDVNVTVSAAYTGLQLKPTSSIIMSRVDLIEDADDDIVLAPPRLVEIIGITYPELFALQDLSLSLVLQQDLREVVSRDQRVIAEGAPAPAGGGGIINTRYWGAALSGPVVPSVYHDLFFYVETGRSFSDIASIYEYRPILAYMAGIRLRIYKPTLRVSLDVVYASGDDDAEGLPGGNTGGDAQTFSPISKKSMALVFSPRIQNLVFVQLSQSIKPMDLIQAEIKTAMFFRPADGAINEGGLDPASNDSYLGTEVDLIVNLRPFSDLGVTLSGGLFWPAVGATFLEEYGDLKGLVRLEASFGL